jgi:hypothetical protein
MSDFKYEIKKTVFSINSDTDGWNLELNLISWNGREPKWDLRKWSSDHEKMGKGCSMSEDEVVIMFQKSADILEGITGESVSKIQSKEDGINESEVLPFS